MTDIVKNVLESAILGVGLASIVYWILIISGKIPAVSREAFKWWIKIIVIQSIVVMYSIKILGLI